MEASTRGGYQAAWRTVLTWPIGAEPACWGLPGSSRLPRIYADFDEEAMGINLVRYSSHALLVEREKAPSHSWTSPVHCPSARGRGEPYCAVNANYPVDGINCRHIAENKDGYMSRWTTATHAPVDLTFRRFTEYPVMVAPATTGLKGATSS